MGSKIAPFTRKPNPLVQSTDQHVKPHTKINKKGEGKKATEDLHTK